MTCAHDKKELEKLSIGTVENEPCTHCKMRYFERLPGYIDVEMVSEDNCMSLYEGEYKFSIPVCLCQPIEEYKKACILSIQENKKEKMQKGVNEAIESLNKYVEEYKFAKFKDLEEMQTAFQNLKGAEEKINQLMGDGDTENEDLLNRSKEVTTMSSKILRGMAAEMRMMAMKKSS